MPSIDKDKAGCLDAIFSITQFAVITPIYAYLWYRLFTLAGATTSDFALLWLYVGLASVFALIRTIFKVFVSQE